MAKKTQGITVTFWHNGNKIREYHRDATRQGCRYYGVDYSSEQFCVLFNADNQIIASFESNQLVCVEDHNP